MLCSRLVSCTRHLRGQINRTGLACAAGLSTGTGAARPVGSYDAETDRPMKPVFCDFPLDRAGHVRNSAEVEAELQQLDNAVLVLLRDGEALCQSEATGVSSEATLALVKLFPLREHRGHVQQPLIFLGKSKDGAPHFAAHSDQSPPIAEGMSWVDLRKDSGKIVPADAALAGTANGILEWHRSCKYSEVTGQPLVPGQAGWARIDESTSKYARKKCQL